jgi:hypothetical protein
LKRETLFEPVQKPESPRGPKAQESMRSRPGLNHREATRDTAFVMGANRWSADVKP